MLIQYIWIKHESSETSNMKAPYPFCHEKFPSAHVFIFKNVKIIF